MTGTIKCQCGKVVIKVQNPNPRYRLQCACCDCRQAVQWANLQGGPKVPNQPLDVWYFENDIEITTGKDMLKWIKLRSDGKALRCFAKCCYTAVMTHHPDYNNNVFSVHTDFAILGADILKEMTPQMRIQMKDFPKAMLDQVEPFEKGKNWINNDYYGRFGVFSAIFTFFIDPYGPFSQLSAMVRAEKTSDLIKEARDITILHLKEYDELL